MEYVEKDARWAWVTPFKPDLVNISALENNVTEVRLVKSGKPGKLGGYEDYRAQVILAFVHETAHTADFLLQSHDAVHDSTVKEDIDYIVFADNNWSSEVNDIAQEIISRNRLRKGFQQEWQRIHQAFVNVGYAQPYHGRGDLNMTEMEMIEMGVTSGYGGHKLSDDIAEMTAGVLVGPAYKAEGATIPPPNVACRAMQGTSGTDMPSVFKAVDKTGPGIPEYLGSE